MEVAVNGKNIFLLVLLCLLLTACSSTKQNKYAFVDLPKVLSFHPLFPEYEKIQKNIVLLEKQRENQLNMARGQMTALDKMVGRSSENRVKFEGAILQAKLSEIDAAAHVKFMQKRADLLGEIQEKFRVQEQEIYDKYKLRIFNARSKLQMLKLDDKRKQDLVAELQAAEKAQNEEIRALNDVKLKAIQKDLQDYEESLKSELGKEAEQIRDKLLQESGLRNADMDKKLDALAKELENTLLDLDKEIINQQNRRDIIYNRMHQDIEKEAADIAQNKDYKVVFTAVRVNLKAVDITEDVSAKIKK